MMSKSLSLKIGKIKMILIEKVRAQTIEMDFQVNKRKLQ